MLPSNSRVIAQINRISKSADIARFLGASAIFYYHIGLFTGCPLSQWGEYAVAVFIILSGIAYTCFSSIRPDSLSSYWRYIGGRLGAIFPIFLAVNIGIFLASYLYPSALGRPFTFPELVLSSSGLSQYFGYRYLSTPMWFVPLIIQAYCLFPIIDSLLNRISPVLIILVAFVASTLSIIAIFECWPSHAVEICRDWSVIFRLPEVCLGVIVGKCLIDRRNSRSGAIAIATFALVSLILTAVFSGRFPQAAYILSLTWHGLIVTIMIAVLATFGAGVLTHAKSAKIFRAIAVASFPFFLAHGVAILFVYHQFGKLGAAWAVYFIFCWFAAITFTFLFNYASHSMQRVNAHRTRNAS